MTELEQTHSNYPHANDEINLIQLFNVLWEEKKLIILIAAVFAMCSILFSFLLTNHYKSESLLFVQSQSNTPGLLSQYSNLAAMTGISLPSSGTDKTMEAIEMIKSRSFLKHLLIFENVLPSIMAAKSYDVESETLLFNPGIYDQNNKTWIGKLDKGGRPKPSYLETHEVYLKELLSISQDKMTNFISIKVEHISPIFAKDFLGLIIREANSLLRQRDLDQSGDALEYLKAELSKTSLVAIKESINALIEVQLETQMMAKINTDYVLRTIEPPFIPEKKSKPARAVICILGSMLGGMFGIFTVLVRKSFH